MFKINIERETIKNNNYRKVIYTDKFQQIVLMSLNVGEYIHQETHNGTQFFRIEQYNITFVEKIMTICQSYGWSKLVCLY